MKFCSVGVQFGVVEFVPETPTPKLRPQTLTPITTSSSRITVCTCAFLLKIVPVFVTF